ncbi:MAG: 50S ribosomal protein L22 [Acidimicrobiales bacterium]
MSFGTKTNERPGTRAQVKYTRVSAYKAREVLDLIRDEPVARALEILEFAERDVARVILKCLESAIANAEHNDQIPADELYVSACFADEGPTLKRWRPRARGRATRIRKRTCHITIIVSRIAPEKLELMRQRELVSGGRGGGQAAAEARRQRVLRSRQSKAEKKAAEAEAEHDHDHDHDEVEPTAAEVAEVEDAEGIVDQQAVALAEAEAAGDTETEVVAADDTETTDAEAGDDAPADEDKDS